MEAASVALLAWFGLGGACVQHVQPAGGRALNVGVQHITVFERLSLLPKTKVNVLGENQSDSTHRSLVCLNVQLYKSGGTLNTWRSGDDGRPVTERLQVRF
jgi:hypothetical protein